MKKILIIPFLTILLFAINSCDDSILDVPNLGAFGTEVWDDAKLTNAYLTDLYATLPGWPVNNGNNADESGGVLPTGVVQTTSGSFKYWPYSAIRKFNVLLNEIDNGNLPDHVKENAKGQTYFLRAFQYFGAVIHHGGVPIIKVPQLLTDDLMIPRSSTKECFDFIIEDLDKAISLLPDRNTGSDYGRIDKAAALAFKGRVLLFKASPQFNPANPYDNTYWSDAYTATKAAKDQLEAWGYGLVSDYDDIFKTEGHNEAVLPVIYIEPGKVNGRQEHAVRPLSESRHATEADQPIWELVSSYPMKDGRMPGSSSEYTYDVQTYWENRDPRFYSTIMYHGSVAPLGVHENRRQYNDGQLGDILDAFWEGNTTFLRTGFFCNKGIDHSLTQAESQLNSYDWLVIRFAEVLMNYAEAANETGRPDEALSVLKQIRHRAGIDPGTDGMYGITATNREEIREAIHLENYIEFAFEGRRFWELRRTRQLHTVIHGMIKHGLYPTLKEGLDPYAPVIYGPEDFDYEIRRPFYLGDFVMYTPEEYYFFPIHRGQIDINPLLEQNIGWDNGTFDPTL